jgi:hypothetical protein
MVTEPHDHEEGTGGGRLEAEVLVGRLVDGEASPEELGRFTDLADADASMWKTLALRQIDMRLLADRVAVQTAAAERVELHPRPKRRAHRALLMMSGWAAVLALGAWWSLHDAAAARRAGPSLPVTAPQEAAPELTPREHLREYLRSPHVLGELDVILMETTDLGDGVYEYRFLRRIEEAVVSRTPLPELLDEEGRPDIERARPLPAAEEPSPPH